MLKRRIIKACLFLQVLCLVNAHAFYCKEDFYRDTQIQIDNSEKFSTIFVDIPSFCIGKDNFTNKTPDWSERTMGCLFAGVLYGVMPIFASGAVGVPGALGAWGVGGAFWWEADYRPAQFLMMTQITKYYRGIQPEQSLRALRLYFFSTHHPRKDTRWDTFKVQTKDIANFLDSVRDDNTLCNETPQRERGLFIKDAGIEYLEKYGYSKWDLIFNDELPKDIKDHVMANYMYSKTTLYDTTIPSAQFKRLVRDFVQNK